MTGADRQRIDKWLWFARLAKTRTAAQKLAISGRVRVNREKNESASRAVKVGDVLTVALESGVRILRIASSGERRGRAAEARLLYEDLTPPAPIAPATPEAPHPGSRPTKRDRRARVAFMGRSDGTGEDFPENDD
jgi:ribosome-associated heat shock protein Hsp15